MTNLSSDPDTVAASALTTNKTHLPSSSFSRVTSKTRDRAAQRGEAMPDGSFPIRDGADLKRAIQAFGRAKDKGAAKRHIIRRARALGKVELLPDSWKVTAAREFPGQRISPEAAPIGVVASTPSPLDDELLMKAARHNAGAPAQLKVTPAKLKAVYNRGLTAFTPRPCVTCEQYAHARVNSFLRLLANGAPDVASYTADNDLLPRSHPVALAVVYPFV